jgi:hypothetical protein
MPLHWTISHPNRLVVAVAKETVTLDDIRNYLDEVVVEGTMGYRKIFDMTHGDPQLSDDDMMQLGARIRAYASTGRMGPLAIVASTDEAYERARLFSTLASVDRPLKIFRELHTARKWLDQQPTV